MISLKMLKSKSGRVKILTLLSLCCYLILVLNLALHDDDQRRHRLLSIDTNCTLEPTKEIGPDDPKIFIASFPGSGARISWKLVEALSGKPTSDEWNTNGLEKNVIGVKTHWPHPSHGHKLEWGDEIKRAFILIRNPLDVLPAFHNTIYASMKNDGSKTAPTESWLKWRDANFNQQLFLWRIHTQYWLDRYKPEDRLVISYERFIDEIEGSLFSEELNKFIGDGLGNPATDSSKVSCIWSKIISQEDGHLEENFPDVNIRESRALRRYKYSLERAYTKEQYNQMVVIIRNLRIKYGKEKRLDNTFKFFDAAIKKARDEQKYNNLYIV